MRAILPRLRGLPHFDIARARWSAVLIWCGLVAAAGAPAWAQARTGRIVFVLDQESARFAPLVAAAEKEIRGFFRPGAIDFAPVLTGDGTAASVATLLAQAYRDPSVSVVVTLGAVGLPSAGPRGAAAEPAIAASVIDAPGSSPAAERRQRRPQPHLRGSVVSGGEHHRGLPPADPVPEAGDRAGPGPARRDPSARAPAPPRWCARRERGRDRARRGRRRCDPRRAAGRHRRGLPHSAARDVGGRERAPHRRAHARRLPTLSYLADPDIRLGALASYEPPENWRRRARRVAVDLQRIIAGEDAGTLPVRLVSAPRLTLNLATARADRLLSRLEPPHRCRAGRRGLGRSGRYAGAGARRCAAPREANLDLAAADLEVASGRQDVRLARSNLLPQVESQIGETFTRERNGRGEPGPAAGAPARRRPHALGSALLASRPGPATARSGVFSASREAERDQLRLDVVLDAATAYLDVLRARTLGGRAAVQPVPHPLQSRGGPAPRKRRQREPGRHLSLAGRGGQRAARPDRGRGAGPGGIARAQAHPESPAGPAARPTAGCAGEPALLAQDSTRARVVRRSGAVCRADGVPGGRGVPALARAGRGPRRPSRRSAGSAPRPAGPSGCPPSISRAG